VLELGGNISVQSYRAELVGAFGEVARSSLDAFGELIEFDSKRLVPSPTSPPLPIRIVHGRRKRNYKRTGKLKVSIERKVRKVYRGEGFELRVSTGEGARGFHYGFAVEHGLPGRPNYRFTPYMKPAFEKNVPALPNIMQLTAQKVARDALMKGTMRRARYVERKAIRSQLGDLGELD